jgi:hypothetical protein
MRDERRGNAAAHLGERRHLELERHERVAHVGRVDREDLGGVALAGDADICAGFRHAS